MATAPMTSRVLATRSAATLARSAGRPCAAHPALPSGRLSLSQHRLLSMTQRRLLQNQQFQTQQIPPQFQHFSSPPPPPPRTRSRFRLFTLSRTLFLAAATLTYFAGARLLETKLGERLALNIPATPEGRALTAEIQREMWAESERIDLVKRMKSDPSWEEWAMGPDGGPAAANSESSDDDDAPGRVRLTTGPMGGLDGMGGCHRIFRNAQTGQVVSIIFVGANLAGWPMVVHGGALATILDEALGRCAILLLAAGTAVTARLELTYKRKSLTSNFVAVICQPDPDDVAPDELQQQLAQQQQGGGGGSGSGGKLDRRKMWCTARLLPIDKDGRTGSTNVEARALFVVPQRYALPKVKQMF